MADYHIVEDCTTRTVKIKADRENRYRFRRKDSGQEYEVGSCYFWYTDDLPPRGTIFGYRFLPDGTRAIRPESFDLDDENVFWSKDLKYFLDLAKRFDKRA